MSRLGLEERQVLGEGPASGLLRLLAQDVGQTQLSPAKELCNREQKVVNRKKRGIRQFFS